MYKSVPTITVCVCVYMYKSVPTITVCVCVYMYKSVPTITVRVCVYMYHRDLNFHRAVLLRIADIHALFLQMLASYNAICI